ncbi:synaptic vesicle glycoprotein 2C isoform 2-T6 [Glossina fuscipes fuscipes]
MVEGNSEKAGNNSATTTTTYTTTTTTTTTAAAAPPAPAGTTIDNRSILQPYSIVVDSKNPGYQFINTSYETDKHDVEKAFNNGSGGRRSLPGIKAGFEQAIELCGYGKFHYVLLAICGLVSTSEEMDVISMSFILPSAQCDLNLNTKSKGWLNSIIFIGMMVGAYFWGSIADSVGRKKVLIVISFMNGFCIVASSFSQTFEWFMFFRFLNGAALGGSGPVIWSYFAEFQPKAKRGCMLSFMAAFWTFGNLFVAGLAWLIIPTNIGFVTSIFTYNSWRIFLMVCSTPSFLVAFLLFYLPESPKFLLSKGKPDRAMAIFRGIFVTNNKKSPDLYPVAELDFDEKLMQELKEKRESLKGKYTKMLSNMAEHSKELFRRPILKFTIVSITINFTFHIGYYGLMMWFPELFSRFEEYSNTFPNQTAGVCIVTDYIVGKGNQDNAICSAHIPSAVFMESLISLASALPANLIAILGMDWLGRKFFLIFGTMTAGVCSAAMYFVYNSTQNLIATAVFSGAISTANAALDCLITEVFPTHLRATGVAVSMVAARMGGIIGNIVIATLLDQYCPAPTIIVAVLLIGGGLMSLFLPNTTRKELN